MCQYFSKKTIYLAIIKNTKPVQILFPRYSLGNLAVLASSSVYFLFSRLVALNAPRTYASDDTSCVCGFLPKKPPNAGGFVYYILYSCQARFSNTLSIKPYSFASALLIK